MNYIELAKQAGLDWHTGWTLEDGEPNRFEALCKLAAAHEREAIVKSIEELLPVEDNPILQNKPAVFWIRNFRQIVYARDEA